MGKTKAKKVARMKANELKVNPVTVCPSLLMATTFPNPYIQTSIPFLNGTPKPNTFYVTLTIIHFFMTHQIYEKYNESGNLMLQQGCLAIAKVKNVAKAHVNVYEETFGIAAFGTAAIGTPAFGTAAFGAVAFGTMEEDSGSDSSRQLHF
ncbi:hypothetical protein GOBAR_DD20496 [Gossypium barbadense]|nr:hypothetical protein GOBAR_DD20496 [Gossypium barbadense]